MSSILYCSIGISGSGKSRLGNILKSLTDVEIICPDDERKLLTGNISDQSKNDEVFSNCFSKTSKLLYNSKDVYFSATSLSKKDRKMLFNIANKTNAIVVALVLEDSKNPELCLSRVQSDLSSGVERSNTTTLVEGESVVLRQYKKFINNYKSIEDDPFSYIIYYNDSCDLKSELGLIKLS